MFVFFFFFQAEDGIRDRSPSRGLGDVYKRQIENRAIKHTYCDNSLWTVYMVTDGMVCMYNGEKVINIDMPELD